MTPRVLLVLGLAAAMPAHPASAQDPPVAIVQPGAPGESSRVITAAAATDLSNVAYTAADVAFMQHMIAHHAQAIEMVDLIAARTTRESVRLLGLRIRASQEDEMGMMRRWLEKRGQEVPGEHAHHLPGALMPGMLTPEEMARLAAASGAEFDRLFLEGMIRHHGGAVDMVSELYKTPGAGQEVEMFTFAADVESDQRLEIDRMASLLDAVMKELRR